MIATEEEDLPARVKEMTDGKGGRIVFDPVGDDYIHVLGQATTSGGVIFLYGMLSGKPTPYPMTTFSRHVSMVAASIVERSGRNTPRP